MLKKASLQVAAKDKINTSYKFNIEFYVFMEKDAYIAYCPSLDISACANTEKEAVYNFYEMFQLHMEYCVERGTLFEDLARHGWKIKKKNILPPTFTSLLGKSPEIKKLVRGHSSYRKIVTPVSFV